MTFTAYCSKTGRYIKVPGNPSDYSKQKLDDLCYGMTHFSLPLGSKFKIKDHGTAEIIEEIKNKNCYRRS